MFSWPSQSSSSLRMISENSSDAHEIPMCSRLYLNRPTCVVIVVKLRDSSASMTWWNALVMSSLQNTLAPSTRCTMSSSVRVGWRVRFIALLSGLQSHVSRTWRSAPTACFDSLEPVNFGPFGTTTKLEMYGVGPFTRSMMPASSWTCSSRSTASRRWTATVRSFCLTGCTCSSTLSLTSTPRMQPMPSVNSAGKRSFHCCVVCSS